MAAPTNILHPVGPGAPTGIGGQKFRPPAGPVVAPPTAGQQNAHAILNELLDGYGLGDLAAWAWTTYTGAGGGTLGMQVVQDELPNTSQFKARFPAIGQRAHAGLPPITVTDYINYEQGLRQAFISNGIALPITGQGFNDIVNNLLTSDVSLNEVVNDRIGKALSDYAAAPAEVKQAFEQVYGVHGAAALATHILDPKLAAPEIDKLAQAAQFLGTGRHFGIDLGVHDAIALAGQDLGQSGTGQQQFFKLGQLSPLFQANAGESPNLTAANQGVGFAFGTDAQAALEVERRLAGREAAFAGGGGSAVTSKGAIGLGPTPQT